MPGAAPADRFAQYDSLDALGLADLVRRGETSALELVEAAIDRIERRNPRLNAVVAKTYEAARGRARSVLPDGPFRGVPFLLKDALGALEGAPLSSGSRIYAGYTPPGSSRLVQRYLSAGLVVVGKTSTPEFALMPVTDPELFGSARNPWDPACTTGGSSGGSAAAVAARMVPVASGGDGGGSIRIPSACCGIFGLKPTRGRTPVGPFEGDVWQGFSVEHVLTRTVRDSAAMLDATLGHEPGELASLPAPERPYLAETERDPGKLRVAFSPRSPLTREVHPDCAAALEAALVLLRELGHETVELDLALDGAEWKRTNTVMMCGITAADVRDAESRLGRRASRGDFERATWLARVVGEAMTAGEYEAAMRTQKRMAGAIAAQLGPYDAWLTPTLGCPPPPVGVFRETGVMALAEEAVARLGLARVARGSGAIEALSERIFAFMPFTMLVNGPGLPSASLPLHWNAAGLPIGVMLTTRFGDEATLFRLAAQLEKARPWAHRAPPLL